MTLYIVIGGLFSNKVLLDAIFIKNLTTNSGMVEVSAVTFPVIQAFQYGVVPGIFTRLKWSLVPPDFKECCIRYS